MITTLSILSILATILNVAIIFGAGYATACYIQYKRNKKSNITYEESKEVRA